MLNPLVTTGVALQALAANKLRSFLTMLGIVIGVAAVITMVALGTGAQESIRSRIASLGTTMLTVVPGQQRAGGVASAADRAALKIDDAEALEDRAGAVAAVQPEMSRTLTLQHGSRNASTTVVATTSNYLEVRNSSLAAGRMFTSSEDAAKRRVAVVGASVVTNLGLSAPAALVGADVRIGGAQFTVIGVLSPRGQAMGPMDPDDQVLVPLQTGRYRLLGGDRLRSIQVVSPSEAEIATTMAEIRRVLRLQHRLRSGQADDFTIRSQADFLNTLSQTTQTFSLLLAGIAAVSLFVGGIGIMNIMLVSVTERTREIGLRKAIGARRRDILLQFMIEALTLCLLGGLVGVLVGALASLVLRAGLHWNASFGLSSVLIAFGFSAAIGVLFGVWPARRAASLDPIEALRYE